MLTANLLMSGKRHKGLTLTAQKSQESRRMIVTIQAIKVLLKNSQNRYVRMAVTLKKRWKNEATGCLRIG